MSGREIIADPLNKKKKIELRQGGTHRQIVSRGCEPLQRGTFLRRAGEWPILGTSPASAPSEDDEKVGGRFSGGSIPGGYGKSPFSLDCTYHGCHQFSFRGQALRFLAPMFFASQPGEIIVNTGDITIRFPLERPAQVMNPVFVLIQEVQGSERSPGSPSCGHQHRPRRGLSSAVFLCGPG